MGTTDRPQRRDSARRLIGPPAVAVAALLVSVVLLGAAPAGPSSPDRPPRARWAAQGPSLRSFESCDQLAGYARRHREALGEPFGTIEDGAIREAVPSAAVGEAATSGSVAAGEPVGSSTNVQEQGVDEPDLVKSDGTHIFAIAGDRLEAVDVAGPATVGSLSLPSGPGPGNYSAGHELLLAGDRVLVISNAYLSRAPWSRTVLTEVDVSDPAAMRAVRTMTVDGAYVSARLGGSTARVVTSATASPEPEPIPLARLRDRAAGTVARSPLMPCEDVSRPSRFSGLGMLSVLTIDLRQGLAPIDTDAVMTDGEIVYGSPESLYVATERWLDPDGQGAGTSQVATQIHRFDVADPGSTEYRATGRVPGSMLSQWSMSEHEGLLRVAATTAPPWQADDPSAAGESFVG